MSKTLFSTQIAKSEPKSPDFLVRIYLDAIIETMNNRDKIKEYVSHFSAAKLWNIPYIDYFLPKEYIDQHKHNIVTDITVTNPNLRYSRKNYNIQRRQASKVVALKKKQ